MTLFGIFYFRSSNQLFLFLSLILLLTCSIGRVRGACVMYDTCHKLQSSNLNCPRNFTNPVALADPAVAARLSAACPYMNRAAYEPVCCAPSQVEDLSVKLRLAGGLLSRCPSCFDNFQKLWCEFTCSPNQSNFVSVTETVEIPSKNESYVNRVRYDISKDFVEGTFNSCQEVRLSQEQALKLMCISSKNSTRCTVDRWLKFMGTQNLKMNIPFNIDFVLHEQSPSTSSQYMSLSSSRCDQSPRVGLSTCSRVDCPLVQNTQEFFPQDTGTLETCRFLGIGCTVYFLVFACIIFAAVIVCVVTANVFKLEEDRLHEYKGVDTNKGTIGSVAQWIEKQIKVNCSMYGEFMATHRALVALFGVFICVVSCCGLAFVRLTSDPIELWSAPNSRARMEKHFFDTNFGPFYRVQQVIVYPKYDNSENSSIGPVFEKEFLREVFSIVSRIRNISATLPDGRTVVLGDVCYRPLGPTYDCLINSPTNYFQHDVSLLDVTHTKEVGEEEEEYDAFDYYEDENEEKKSETAPMFTYIDHISECLQSPLNIDTSFGQSCLGTYGGPTYPQLIFGGAGTDYANASALTLSIILSGQSNLKKSMAWEQSFINTMRDYKHDNVQISYMAERSISDEIQRESESDGWIIMISCILMVLYVIFALGVYTVEQNQLLSLLIHSKILVGLSGMVVIFFSVVSSIGVFSLYGMIVPQSALVVQFFVMLIIGANRIFATVSSVQRMSTLACETVSDLMYRVCGDVIPEMILMTVAESLCFFIGALIPVPAVRCFCLFAALAVIFEFVFHCTLFLPILVVDIKREQNGKPEIFCCHEIECDVPEYDGYVRTIIEKYYAPMLMRPWPKTIVVAIGLAAVLLSPLGFPMIPLGLDQKMAVPEDSYVYLHFKNMDKYLSVGPPVYFVVQGDVKLNEKKWQDKFCTLGGCAENSVGAILTQATRNSNVTYLRGDVLNWMDNYLSWLSPASECCMKSPNSSALCPRSMFDRNSKCVLCDRGTSDGRPTSRGFYSHLNDFLNDVPSHDCVHGGRAAFRNALRLDPRGHVEASHFMTYHTPLKGSDDFIAAMEGARMVARKIEHAHNYRIKVFPYSVYYVFYDQYLTIRVEAATQLIISLTAIFGTICLLSGLDPWSAVFCAGASFFHLISLVSLMALWNIEFNPITAVNLIMGVGASLEFFVPIVMAFSQSLQNNKVERAKEALVNAGSTVFSGVFLTMLSGTIVLAFAHSQFFKVFYFRMFLGIVLSGAFHGLALLPVVLSYCGPPIKRWRKQEQMREEDARVNNAGEQLRDNLPTALSTNSHIHKNHSDSFHPLLGPCPETTKSGESSSGPTSS